MSNGAGDFEEEIESSDDDYVHPSIDKYFDKNEKNSVGKKSKKDVEEEEEEEEDTESEFEMEEEEDDDDDMDDEEKGSDDEAEAQGKESKDGAKAQDSEEESDDRKKVTLKMVEKWSEKLTQEKPFQTINEVVKAFKSALLNVVPNNKSLKTSFKVEGSEMFNAMVRLCLRDFLPCLLRLLNLNPSKPAQKGQKAEEPSAKIKLANSGAYWKKLKVPVKSYLTDMLVLATNVYDHDILNAILRHIRLLINFYLCFPKLLKSLIKFLITVWSQNDEKSRVISYICLHKLVANTHPKNQDLIYKSLYLSFVRNAKFTSINTLPLINFMQRSLIELYSTNLKLAYEHVFVYVRQLAIHLRNAMNLKKKESYQAVYNWQYVHSLILWSKLLSLLSNPSRDSNEFLQPLIYPLVQCIIGTIKLIPTPRYYPLRFHCINALIMLSNSTNVFIPIIPFVLEVLDITDFNKKHATISPKQMNFSFLLKLNKQQLQDKSFKDTLVDIIYDNLILLLQHQSYDIAFPELVLPLTIRLKDFTKKCKNANYCKVIKGLLDKIQENTKCIEERRNKVTFSIRDKKQVDIWIEKNKELGTPISQWYTRYKTMREREIMMEISNKEVISKNQVPKIERPTRTNEQKEEERKEFGGLFVNLSDDESDTELTDFVPKKKKEKNENEENVEEEDNFSDLGEQSSADEEDDK